MRVLFATGSAAGYMKPPILGDEQIVCGPDWIDERSSDGRVRSLKTPVGEYDLAAIAAKLPKNQQPDVVVCLVDAAWRNLPRNLAAFSCPKVLLIADTHHLTTPLMSMLRYMASEPYDRSVFLYDRHHASFFHAAGFRNLYWFPGLTFPHTDEKVRKARAQGVRQPQIAFVGQVGLRHPLRSRLYAAMLEKKLPVVQKKLSQVESLGFYGSSLLAFNASLNGDLNLRVFETLSAGATLLTDRLTPESGLERLLADGREMLTYGSADELIEKATHALANPRETQAIGRAGSDWFDQRLNEAWRRKAFQELAFDGKAVPEFEFSAEEKTRVYFGGDTDRLLQAMMVYEGVQEMHRVEPMVRVALVPGVPEDVATMYATLPRLEIQRVEKETADVFDVTVFGRTSTVVPSARCLWCWDTQEGDAGLLAMQLQSTGYSLVSRDVAMFCQMQQTVPDTYASAYYWHHLGVLHRTQGKPLDALAALLQAVALNPDGADSQMELGMTALANGHGAIAREAFSEVLRLCPGDKNAEEGLARAKKCEAACDYNRPRDLLLSHCEVTRLHGSGVLLQRFFPDSNDFITVRPRSLYGNRVDFGGVHFAIDLPSLSDEARAGIFRRLLRPYRIRRILVVPYFSGDLVHALVAREMTGAPLCTYVMDDQVLYADGLTQEMTKKVFDASDLRLAISPEMVSEYTAAFGCSFGLLPPIVANRNDEVPNVWSANTRESVHCAMVGNIWSAQQFGQLRAFIGAAGLRVDWFGNANAPWIPQNHAELEAEGLYCKGFLTENLLAERLSTYPFVLLPSGTLDGSEKNEWLTRLSLPSRMVFILTKTLTPILVLGNEKTAAARFANRFEIGTSSNYNVGEAREKIAKIIAPENRTRMLDIARRLAPCFLMPDCGAWIWRSLAAKRPQATPFDHLYSAELEAAAATLARPGLPNAGSNMENQKPTTSINPIKAAPEKAPDNIPEGFISAYDKLRLLGSCGFTPGNVLDVGASTGVWSYVCGHVFPNANYSLVEPLHEYYRTKMTNPQGGEWNVFPVALGASVGEIEVFVPEAGYGLYEASAMEEGTQRQGEKVKVPQTSIDYLVAEGRLPVPDLVKLDVQGYELHVLAGADCLWGKTEAFIVEVSLYRFWPGAPLMIDIIKFFDQRGYFVFDLTGEYRTAPLGQLQQIDLIFIRKQGDFAQRNKLATV